MKELRDHVIAELEMKLGERYRITPYDKTLNNGLIQHGICVTKMNDLIGFIFYPKGNIRNHSTGEIADVILKLWGQSTYQRLMWGAMLNPKTIKNRIRMKLVNYDANKKELENVPHRRLIR